jgi:hypothetical protein
MMDWVRLVLLVEVLIITVLYGYSSAQMWWQLHLHRKDMKGYTYTITIGRFVRCLCVLLLASSGVYGYIELWGTEYSWRLILAELGWITAMVSWGLVERHVNVGKAFEAERVLLKMSRGQG